MGAPQEPDYCGKQYYRGFHKEIALLAHPRFVKVEHYGVCRFVCVGNIRHEIRVYRIAPVAPFRVIEINNIK